MGAFRFSASIPVRYSDLDAQGHVNHARCFSFMEEARFQYFRALGLWDESAGFDAVGQIVAEATCSYKRPIRLGETVEVAVRTSRIGTKSMVMDYRLTVGGEEAAAGRTVQVAYDYAAHCSIPVPEDWRARIEAYEGVAAPD